MTRNNGNFFIPVLNDVGYVISHQLQGVPLYTLESKALLSHNPVFPERRSFHHPLLSLHQHRAALVYHAEIKYYIWKARNKQGDHLKKTYIAILDFSFCHSTHLDGKQN